MVDDEKDSSGDVTEVGGDRTGEGPGPARLADEEIETVPAPGEEAKDTDDTDDNDDSDADVTDEGDADDEGGDADTADTDDADSTDS